MHLRTRSPRAAAARAAFLLTTSLLALSVGPALLTGCQADRPLSASDPAASDPTATTAATGPGPAASTPADVVVIEVTLRQGTVDPNGTKIPVRVGQTVLIKVTSDHDDAVHVHSDPGLELSVPAGQTVHGSFVASQSGSFEVESHHPPKVIAVLNVR